MEVIHHKKYKEIHGVDETFLLTPSEHKKLHNRLRREGKCSVAVDILEKISRQAHRRTAKYRETTKRKEASPEGKENHKRYNQKSRQHLIFTETLLPNIVLYEDISYNKLTGNLIICSYFLGSNKHRVIEVNI